MVIYCLLENRPSLTIAAKSKKQRQLAAKAARRAEKERSGALFPSVPLEEQTIDLPSGDGTAEGGRLAEQARADLNLAMRKSRRKSIKERNYLGGMP
jgi:large subunit ribosomal protein L54